MRLKLAIPAILLLAVAAIAGDQLPASGAWNGTDSQGDHRTEVKSSSSGNAITLTKIKTNSEGVSQVSALGAAWDSTDSKYHTPQGGTVEFNDVVNGNTTAYNYTHKDAAGNVVETGLVSSNLP